MFCGMYNSLYTRLANSSHESFKQSRQIQVQKSVVRRLHAIFRSKVAGSPGGGVTTFNLCRVVVLVHNKLSLKGPYVRIIIKFRIYCISQFYLL